MLRRTGMSLLAVTVWLRQTGRPYAFTAVPMVFVLAVTLSSLTLIIYQVISDRGAVTIMNAAVSGFLVILALALVVSAVRKFMGVRAPEMAS